jgi:hypothetical protein
VTAASRPALVADFQGWTGWVPVISAFVCWILENGLGPSMENPETNLYPERPKSNEILWINGRVDILAEPAI